MAGVGSSPSGVQQKFAEEAALPDRRLSRRAITALLNGRHAEKGGRTRRVQGQNLVVIAAAYSEAELLAEKGIGDYTATEIKQWLRWHGAQLAIVR